jgi:tryptophanyl-tRNA synthetase
MKNIILTGDRPTGRLHVGHYVGSLYERLRLQNETNYDEYIILIADAQALTDNFDNPKKVRENIIEVMLDYLAVGLDPNKITFALQSEVRALPELTEYYQNLVTLPRLLRNPTVKSEIKMRGFEESGEGIPVGFANYPISQAADITGFKANIIPVGDDQLPMLEQTREIVRSFNRIYNTDVLVECKEVLPTNKACHRLPGCDGAKMSKSLGNAIYLADEPNDIKKKVNSIVTFPRALEEPGIIENNVLFVYLDAFAKPEHFKKYYEEFNDLDELKNAYQKGGIGDGRVKKFLFDVLNDTIEPIRERRKELSKDVERILNILKDGSAKANKIADETLREVKEAMGIGYFYDDEFAKEMIKKYQ